MATDLDSTFRRATGRKKQLPGDWMPTSRVRPFIVEDPAEVWLEFFGAKNGFQPDSSPFEFLDFLSQKNRQFLDEWVKREAPRSGASVSGTVRDNLPRKSQKDP